MDAEKIYSSYRELSTPFMLVDIAVIRDHCRLFKKLFPTVTLFYAMKALPEREVLQVVAEESDGFDAASVEEINILLDLGVDPGRIAFNNPVKSPESIEQAIKKGVRVFSFQSREELDKIAKLKVKVDVFVRTKMDDSHSVVPLSTKFGCANDVAIDLLEYAQSLGLNPAGVAFHVGSQQTGLLEWSKAMRVGQDLIKQAQARGLTTSVLNIGGGFPANYANNTTINEVAAEVEKAMEPFRSITYMAEPGRYIVAESSAIVTSIIGIEQRNDKTWLFLDTGIFQAFAGALRFDPFPYPPFCLDCPKSAAQDQQPYILTGPSCDSQDVFPGEMLLPKGLRLGDRLVFPNTGAYTVVYGADFNGFKVPPRVFVDSAKEAV